MDNYFVKVTSNWSQIGGCEFLQAIQLKTADPDVFLRPLLDDIVNEEKSLLLGKGGVEEYCELYIQLYPHYKIQAISLVCNVAKIEIFQGPLKEYLETIYGIIVDEADEHFKTFRYDIEVEKSGITNLTVKFLTHASDVCIFGIMLHTAPNPNGITTLISSPSINIENVQNILQNASKTIAPASEKCKHLLELMTKAKMYPPQSNSNETQPSLDQLVKQWNVGHPHPINVDESKFIDVSQDVEQSLKSYIEKRFQEMEDRINQHLEAMENRQTEKLNNILRILETKQINVDP